MQWLVALFTLSLAIGLRRRLPSGTPALLLLGVVVLVVVWYSHLSYGQ